MIEVGRKVYLKAVGNSTRYSKETQIEERVIVKVGRKFFYVSESTEDSEHRWIPFHIESLKQKTDYNVRWAFYFDRQSILDQEEKQGLQLELSKAFGLWERKNLTLEQLRRIKEIIEEEQ